MDGRELVNRGHHLVIEIWNLVFMAVQPQGQRRTGTAAGPPRGYRHGLRTALHGVAGQTEQLRYRRIPTDDPASGRTVRKSLRSGSQGRYRDAGGCRPPAGDCFLDCRRAAAVEREGRVRDPAYPAPRRAVRIYLPRFQRAVYLPVGRRTRPADGRTVPRTGGAAGSDYQSDRRGGSRIPEDIGYRDQSARQCVQKGTGRRQPG